MSWRFAGPTDVLVTTVREGTVESVGGALRNLATRPQEAVATMVERALGRWAGEPFDGDLSRPSPLFDLDGSGEFLDLGPGGYASADSECVVLVVPPGSEYLDLRVFDDLQDVRAGTSGFGWSVRPEDEEDVYVLVDGFVGATTLRPTILQRLFAGSAGLTIRLAGEGLVLVGRLLRVAARTHEDGPRDPVWSRRLASAEERRPDVVAACPPIEDVPAGAHRRLAVFVHGTASNGVEYAGELRALASVPVLRFEHDTMRPIAENARDLAAQLRRIGARSVVVGHSRGGLVARVAAAEQGIGVERVVTLGTPHRGTPMVDALGGLLSYATVALGQALGSITLGALWSAFTHSANPQMAVAPGWLDMKPGSSLVTLLPLLAEQCPLETFGGEFDHSKPGLASWPASKGRAATRVLGDRHDLVVPTTSSVLVGGVVCDQTDHFSYLRHPDVQRRLAAILV